MGSVDVSCKANYRLKLPPLGLRNLGNTCYLNSVLQCLTFTPPLADLCLRSLHSKQCGNTIAGVCPFCLLEKRILASLKSEAAVDAPLNIHKFLQLYAKHFRDGRQEDAHEFLRYAVDACNNACLRILKMTKKSDSVSTVIKEIFGGVLQSQIRCLSCNEVFNKLDDFMDLSLDVVYAKSLKEASSKFFQAEVLEGNNKYHCEKCKKLSTAKKQLSILEAPNVLVIQLKRFENIYGGKIDRHIAFEDELWLASYMSKESTDLQTEYSLYGVVVHSGYSQYGGHYYSYVKDFKGKWYCCDDSRVSAVGFSEVVSEKAYILFYVRTYSKQKMLLKEKFLSSSTSSTPSPPATPDTDPCKPLRPIPSCTLPLTKSGKLVTRPLKINIKSKPAIKQQDSCELSTTTKIMENSSAAIATGISSSSSALLATDTSSQTTIADNSVEQQQQSQSVIESKGIFPENLKESETEEEMKARLKKLVREVLQQWGWRENVKECMERALKKRRCEDGSCEIRQQQLIEEVRNPCRSQISQSLKQELVEHLNEYYDKKES